MTLYRIHYWWDGRPRCSGLLTAEMLVWVEALLREKGCQYLIEFVPV